MKGGSSALATDMELMLHEMEKLPPALRQQVLDFIRFLQQKATQERLETVLLSEETLARDWLRPEEDEAWQDL